ncbi:Conserved hypothetical protein, membrane [Salinibacter ruber M8]|uniref:Uncharacterized protein n=2 Tax=Salinibacter ruber TaxID=146919 RepID=D5H5F5_SALRM|nr:Conserved hypothetical protein, membrane [Salinibacter ruber M8]
MPHTLVSRGIRPLVLAGILLCGLAPSGIVAAPLPAEPGQSATSGPALSNDRPLPMHIDPMCTRPARPAASPALCPRPMDLLQAGATRAVPAPRQSLAAFRRPPVRRDVPLRQIVLRQRVSRQRMQGPERPALELGDSQAGRALWGSVIGTAVGWALGGVLLAGADEVEAPPQSAGGNQSTPEGVALLLLAGGPPAGAIINTDVEWGNAKAWALGVLGGAVLGGAGIALGTAIGGSDRGEAVGALVLGAPGAAVGGGVGVLLAAPDGRSALRYSAESGTWSAGLPAVRMRPGAGPEADLVGKVSLVTVDL